MVTAHVSALQGLHPHLQHAIVHDLGWRELRPVQDMTIEAVLEGANAVVLAPTAGGKTEASMFPLLSRILSEGLSPVAVLYVCPIRALLNNQEERLQAYARMVGLDVFKWHGDVSDSRKRMFLASPAHVLMTTPESLEVMLISSRTDTRALFSGLSAVVVDEVHAFAGDDRGAHLASILERLVVLCERDVQRIGLSATVGNPELIGRWMQGSSRRPFRLVSPPRAAGSHDLRVEYCGDLGDAAAGIRALARGRKSLVFVESRSKAERVAHAIEGGGVDVFVHHSAVSRADRALAEEQFARGTNTAIVCTSTMELGIDVGDLDQVIQVDAPTSVASFLQRLGRTGRRAGSRANCTFFCVSPESLLQTAAILRLAEAGRVEDVRPPAHAMHVLAHQIMAVTLQEGGVSRHRLSPWLDAAWPFSSIRRERLHELIDTMVEREILYEADGTLSLGLAGEKIYGRQNFFELYAVFSAPPLLRVLHGRQEVGYVQASFVSMHDTNAGPLCFRLGARAWEVVHTDWSRGQLHVRPAEHGRVPTWLGLPGVLSRTLCETMKDVLLHEQAEGWLSGTARAELGTLRDAYGPLLVDGRTTLESGDAGVQWHTFAGGAVNRLLAAALQESTREQWTAGNLSLKCRTLAGGEAHEAVRGLYDVDWEDVAVRAATTMARGPISKFQRCLPKEAEERLLVDRLLDVGGTMQFLGSSDVVRAERDGLSEASDGRRRLSDAELRPVEPETTADFARPKLPIVVVDTLPNLAQLAKHLSTLERIGLDVETTLEFGTLCLIQIATAQETYLIDPLAIGDLQPLASVFESPRPAKVIHNAAFERRVLAASYLHLDGVVDTLDLSRACRGADVPGGHSLAAACQRELGLTVDKSCQTSMWSRRPLTPEQLAYAALDAEVLLQLHDRLVCAPLPFSDQTSHA